MKNRAKSDTISPLRNRKRVTCMGNKVTVLGVDISAVTAREMLAQTVRFMQNERVNTVEVVTKEMLIQCQSNETWREWMQEMDLLIPGDCDIFDVAGITENNILKDVQSRLFLRLFFKYLEKHKNKIFLLAETEEEMEYFRKEICQYSSRVSICGQAVLSPEGGQEEKVVNEINGLLPECIFSVLPCPHQEKFISSFKALVNSKLWFGCRAYFESGKVSERSSGRFYRFMIRKWFRYLVGREKENE